MINLSKDIQSLTDFKRHTNEYVKNLKESKHPLVLTINGKAELVVQDAEAYQALLEAKELLESIKGIQRGLEEAEAGKGRPVQEFFQELLSKYESSR